jgi:hypothetical protein
MTESIAAHSGPDSTANLPALTLAVERCCQAYTEAFNASLSKGTSDFTAALVAAQAYRLAMPSLAAEDSIRDFIDCTAHGILMGAFEDRQGSQLLYAAQVASASFDRARKAQKQKEVRSRKRAT